ncbi:MAG TPA: alpha/beta hydrolase [Puia sp.]|jgi:acetyl esterase/lipase|nr:alpha/beta hydrolase [Puia sp.]
MIRLIISVLLLLTSLLVVIKPPTHLLWMIDVAITNFPYIFIGVVLLLFLLTLFFKKYKIATLVLSFVSLVLFSLPIISALSNNSKITEELNAVFASPNTDELQQPFSFAKMFSGIGADKIKYQPIIYKIVQNDTLTFDYYPSAKENSSLVVVVIHGGSWENGDSKQLPSLNNYLANKGYNVAAMNYRLAPKYKSPAAVEDAKDLINFLKKFHARLKIDTNNFILLGRSAGSQIALTAAYSFHDKNIKGAISFYGPADMVWGAQIKGNNLIMNTDQVYKDYFGGLYNEVPDKFKESSPIEYVNESSPATLIIHGENDVLVSHQHSEHLHKKLDDLHVKNYFLSLPFETHGCDYNINGTGGQQTTYAVEHFINSVVK